MEKNNNEHEIDEEALQKEKDAKFKRNTEMESHKDMISLASLLQLGVETFYGREKLKDLKLKQNKVLVGTAYPANELIWASGCIPVYPIRMQKFRASAVLSALSLGNILFGKEILSKSLLLAKSISAPQINNIINDISQSINEKYNEMSEVGEQYLPSDACFALKFLTGAYMQKSKNLNAQFNFPIRCSSWNSTMEIEELSTKVPVISLSPIPSHLPNARKVLIEEINQAIAKLEKLSGESCSNTHLQRTCEMTQELKEIYNYLVFNVQAGDRYPCNAKTFAQMIVLFEIAFQDYMSDLPLFLKIMKELTAEIKNKMVSEFVDVSHRPKILFATRYGGYDSYIEDLVQESGARIVYADWYQIGFMDPIKTTGNMIENYADYIQSYFDFHYRGNEEYTKRQIETAKRLDVQGVIYNQAFGCHSYTINYTLLKQKLLSELGIPSTLLSFNKIGEGREQMKTRVSALLEMI